MRGVFFKTQGAFVVGQPYSLTDTDLYMEGARWSNPDTVKKPVVNIPIICARLGSGQILGLELGGYYAAQPPAPEEP